MITLISPPPRWSDVVFPIDVERPIVPQPFVLGVLRGEGVGSEVIDSSLEVLQAVTDLADIKVDIQFGGPIGRDAEKLHGVPLSGEVIVFCEQIWAQNGTLLCGPGGGRFVYDMRKQFDMFFKISPIEEWPELAGACKLKPEAVEGVDILVVRENVSGVYQGSSKEGQRENGSRYAEHSFSDEESVIMRFLDSAARLASMRRGILTVVYKDSGVPGVSSLWRDCALKAAETHGIVCTMADIDLVSYRLIQHAQEYDVIAAPNLCGDVLADLAAVLLASRGLAFSGNYTSAGHAVYQTNHGAAYDLAGKDSANPVGQIFSLAMALRESFGLSEQADWIVQAVRTVWAEGWRTADVAEPGGKTIGTREMTRKIVASVTKAAQTSVAVFAAGMLLAF